MKTILSSFSALIDHAPLLKDVMPAAIEDRELLQLIEWHVSLYLMCFAFACPLCTLNRSAKAPRRHIVMTRRRSSSPVSRGSRKTSGHPYNLHSRLTARLAAVLITLSSPGCFVPDQSRISFGKTLSVYSIYFWTSSTYYCCKIY